MMNSHTQIKLWIKVREQLAKDEGFSSTEIAIMFVIIVGIAVAVGAAITTLSDDAVEKIPATVDEITTSG